MNFLQAIEFAFALASIDAQDLMRIDIPTTPFKVGGEWYTVTHIEAPVAPPTS